MELTLNIISTVCTVILTVLGFYTARKYIFKDVYFGDKADDEFEELKLKDKDPIKTYEFSGGKGKIFPQIVIERRIFNKIVTYFVKEGDKRMVKVWYLK